MSVRIENAQGSHACVARIQGDMDLSLVPEIRRGLDDAVASGRTFVVLDLADVTYADSSALGLLVWLDHRLRPLGGRMVLAGADANVSRVLELSGLVGIAPTVTMAPDAEHALEGLDLPPVTSEPTSVTEMSFPARVEELSRARTAVCESVAAAGMSEMAQFDLKVAVGEALANAVRHGSPGEDDGIEVEVAVYGDRIVVSVTDHGEGFDGIAISDDDVFASGGRGVMFMRALTDGVEFLRSSQGGTTVCLTKCLRPAPRVTELL